MLEVLRVSDKNVKDGPPVPTDKQQQAEFAVLSRYRVNERDGCDGKKYVSIQVRPHFL